MRKKYKKMLSQGKSLVYCDTLFDNWIWKRDIVIYLLK